MTDRQLPTHGSKHPRFPKITTKDLQLLKCGESNLENVMCFTHRAGELKPFSILKAIKKKKSKLKDDNSWVLPILFLDLDFFAGNLSVTGLLVKMCISDQ